MDIGILLAAFAVGILGGVHCLGMCGGIVGAISLTQADRSPPNAVRLLAYNAGRMGSYVLAGGLAGFLGATLFSAMPQGQQGLQILAAIVLVLMGLYLAGWWRILAHLESLGGRVWTRIEPLGRRFLPIRTHSHALIVGAIWGWLPCGLVYSVLIWSMTAGGAIPGAMLMAAFALGTLPNLLLMGLFAARMTQFMRKPWVRQVAGSLLIAYGTLYFLWALPVNLTG